MKRTIITTAAALAVAAGLTAVAAEASSTPSLASLFQTSACSGTWQADGTGTLAHVTTGADRGVLLGTVLWDVRTTHGDVRMGPNASLGVTDLAMPYPASTVLSVRASGNLGLSWCTLTRH